jgi:RNA polymerase sigma-70 factor (ECF subfamily)
MRTEGEKELVARAQAGSRDAASRLFERHWSSAWQLAFAITGRRALADDVAQGAFERAFRSLPDFNGRSSFRTWLCRIVTNGALNALREERRIVPEGETDWPIPDWTERVLSDQELVGAVGRLPVERRVALVLRYWFGCTPAEIAELLDVPAGTVHSRLARSLVDLRSQLEAHDAHRS